MYMPMQGDSKCYQNSFSLTHDSHQKLNQTTRAQNKSSLRAQIETALNGAASKVRSKSMHAYI